MRRDKARLRLGGRTLLGLVKEIGQGVGAPVRVIRQDMVPRCGPIGGVFTALKTTRFEAVMFLSCDMPFVSIRLLTNIATRLRSGDAAVFTIQDGTAGFPFVIRTRSLKRIERLIFERRFSLQSMARELGARKVLANARDLPQLLNINTPEDWQLARRFWKESRAPNKVSGL